MPVPIDTAGVVATLPRPSGVRDIAASPSSRPAPALMVSTLRRMSSAFCLVVGVLMLVVPHQFAGSAYALLHPNLTVWGMALAFGGANLFLAGEGHRATALVITSHVVVAVCLFVLALSYAVGHVLTGTINYFGLGLSVLIALFAALRSRDNRFGQSVRHTTSDVHNQSLPDAEALVYPIDLFVVAAGISAVVIGLLFVAVPTMFSSNAYDVVRPNLSWFGIAYAVSGTVVVCTQYFRVLPRVLTWAAHLAIAVAFVWFAAEYSQLAVGWTGLVYYVESATILALLPFAGHHLRRVDLYSLRPRLALTVAGTTAISLLSVAAYVADGEQQMLTAQALAVQQAFAIALAQDVADYISLHRAAILSLAAQPGLLQMAPTSQETLLTVVDQAYPNVSAIAIFDADGNPIARSDGRPPARANGFPVFENARHTLQPSLDVLVSPILKRPVVALGAPIRASTGEFVGLVSAAVSTDRLTLLVSRASESAGSIVYLVDDRGHVIAHSNAIDQSPTTDLSSLPPVGALLSKGGSPGTLVYGEGNAERLAGFAPVSDLGWGIIVEQPASTALASARTGLDRSIELVGLIIVITMASGVLAAGRLATPITVLTRAIDRFTHGDDNAPLPVTNIREIEQLATFFGVMRERLAARTAERDAAEREQLALNDQLHDAVRELEAFSYSVSHDLRAPLRAMNGFARILLDDYSSALDLEAQELLGLVRSNAIQMGTLIDDLLAFSRLSRQPLQRQPVAMGELVQGVLADLTAEHTSIRWDVQVSDLPDSLGDPSLLRQVWINLLSNALKFTKERERPRIDVGWYIENGQTVYFVRDNGVGFNMKYAPKLFIVFQRLHQSSEYEGTGVGLAIVQRIIHRHGGRIWADATVNEGATFFFTLDGSASDV